MTRNRSQTFLKRIVAILLLMGLALAGVVITLYLMLVYRPRSYNPADLSPPARQAALDEGMKKVEEFHNNLSAVRSFEYSLSQQFLNNQMVCDDNLYYFDKLPDRISNRFQRPQFLLRDGVISIMGEVRHEWLRGILAISFSVKLNEDGTIGISLLPLKIGAVTLPQKIQRELLAPLQAELIHAVRQYDAESKKKDLVDRSFGEIIHKLPALLNQQTIALSPVIYPFEDIQAVITSLVISDGLLTLNLVPRRSGS